MGLADQNYSPFQDAYTRSFLDLKSFSGSTDIDDSVQTETTPWVILTIAAPANEDLHDVEVWFDLAKATTGYSTVESTATIAFSVARAVDGTNYRREAIQEAALSGTLAALRAYKVSVGRILAGETVRIMAVMSADATSDINIPYKGYYRGLRAPTVTPIVAG